jgi:hypothetical protein
MATPTGRHDVSQREPHRFDLAAALTRSLESVDLRDFQRRNVNRVRLLKAEELQGSVRLAIDRALADHAAELTRLRDLERTAGTEVESLRCALAEEAAKRAAAEGALAAGEARGAEIDLARREAQTAKEELADLREALHEAQLDAAGARREAEEAATELERARRELAEARERLAEALVERERFRAELLAEPTRTRLTPPAPPGAAIVEAVSEAPARPIEESLSVPPVSPSIPPTEGNGAAAPEPPPADAAPAPVPAASAPAFEEKPAPGAKKQPSRVLYVGFGPGLSKDVLFNVEQGRKARRRAESESRD